MTREIKAEMLLPASELREDIEFYTGVLGMRMDEIFPADDPRIAVFSGHGLRLRLQKGSNQVPGTIRILTDDPYGFADGRTELFAPNGTRVEIAELHPPMVLPETDHAFIVRRLSDEAPWVIGRAGMHYRDLIPNRLGGSIIASHIRIPDGGPVPDVVHYHSVGFQLIFCHRGWVDLVYEDQGDPFRLQAGDCVIQPPEIRHRVLEASADIEVIEIGVPAEHVTTIDHEMELPNGPARPERRFQGQRFVHHRASEAEWAPARSSGYSSRDTGIAAGTDGVASVHVVRRGEGDPDWSVHGADILFTFVLEGSLKLEGAGQESARLSAGDAFVVPPGMKVRLAEPSDDVELLEVALPGRFETRAA